MHDCAVRNPVAKVHTYPDQAFVVLHAPGAGQRGHVHFVELDQFVGPNWLLTVHGPMNPAVALDAAYVETSRDRPPARQRARCTRRRACELSGALVNAVADRMRDFLTELTQDVWQLERQVTGGHIGDPEKFLEELFGVRHGLLAVRTMAASSREVYGRMVRLAVFGAAGAARLVDLEDQFRRIAAMADSQREYLQGVIEFYQTRTGTKMTIAAERLAVIAAVTLPITALSLDHRDERDRQRRTHWRAARGCCWPSCCDVGDRCWSGRGARAGGRRAVRGHGSASASGCTTSISVMDGPKSRRLFVMKRSAPMTTAVARCSASAARSR